MGAEAVGKRSQHRRAVLVVFLALTGASGHGVLARAVTPKPAAPSIAGRAALASGAPPGVAWAARPSGSTGDLNGVACPTASRCLAVGQIENDTSDTLQGPVVLLSSDGGLSWRDEVASAGGDLAQVQYGLGAITCASPSFCLATGTYGLLLTSLDGGLHWRMVDGSSWYGGATCPTLQRCVVLGGDMPVTTDGGSTWRYSNRHTPDSANSVACPTSTLCLAVGGGQPSTGRGAGNISASHDGGVTWKRIRGDDGYGQLFGIDCPGNICLAVGESGNILATTDGGATWQRRASGTPYSLYAIACPTRADCVAVGEYGTMVTSVDGGATWTRSWAGTAFDLHGVTCHSTGSCLAVGDHGTILSSNSVFTRPSAATPTPETTPAPGTPTPAPAAQLGTWAPRAAGTGNDLLSAACDGASDCLAVGTYGTLLRSSDSGGHWLASASSATQTLESVACSRPKLCMAVGDGGAMLTSADSGRSWSDQVTIATGAGILNPDEKDYDLYGLACPNRDECLAVGDDGLSLGYDGAMLIAGPDGASWTSQGALPTNRLNAVACVAGDPCLVVGAAGIVGGGMALEGYIAGQVRTNVWTTRASGVHANLNGIACPGSTCLVVGDAGTILASEDLGATWQPRPSGTAANLNGISCPAIALCVAVGDGGTILASTDGGTSWSAAQSGSGADLHAVACTSASFCLAVGDGGTILAGTQPFAPRSAPIPQPSASATPTPAAAGSPAPAPSSALTLRAVLCQTGTCLVVGDRSSPSRSSGIILSTIGRGHWSSRLGATSTGGLDGAACKAGAAVCLAVGEGGTLLRSADGGGSWQPVAAGTRSGLDAAACVPSGATCLAVGWAGTTLRSTDLGRTWQRQPSVTGDWLHGLTCWAVVNCLAVGDGGTILDTGVLSATWAPRATGTTNSLEGVTCTISLRPTCLAVGDQGTIVVSGDRGATWHASAAGTSADLYAVSCGPRTLPVVACLAVGSGGTILIGTGTLNGGTMGPWHAVRSGTTSDLYGVECADPAAACLAVGAHGTVLSSPDGGTTWQPASGIAEAVGNGAG